MIPKQRIDITKKKNEPSLEPVEVEEIDDETAEYGHPQTRNQISSQPGWCGHTWVIRESLSELFKDGTNAVCPKCLAVSKQQTSDFFR